MNNRTSQKLKFNIIASSLYQLLSMIVPIITIPYVTRIFNLEQMGSYNLTYSLAVFFSLVSKFGIDTYGVREVSKASTVDERDKIYFDLFSIQLINSLILFIIFNFIFMNFTTVNDNWLIFVQSLLLLVNIFDISWFYIGIEEISKTIIRNLVTKLFSTILIFIIIKNSNQLALYALINILGVFLGNLVMFYTSFKYIKYKNYHFNISGYHLRNSVKLFVPKVLNNSYNSIDKSIIQIFSTATNVGLYSEGMKLVKVLFSVIEQAFNAVSPRMSFHIANNEIWQVKIYFNRGLKYSVYFSIILISGILSVSNSFVDFFYGDGYSEISMILNILSVSLAIVPINVLINSGIIIPLSKDKEYIVSTVIMIISGILFSLLLVPQFGASGASIAYNLSQLCLLLYLSYIIKNFINIKRIILSIVYIIFAVLINFLLMSFTFNFIQINNSVLQFIIFGFLSVCISLLECVIINYFDKYI